MKIDPRKIHPSKIPWQMRRNRCARCDGYHAPWWGRAVPPPSCRPGHVPGTWNDTVMMLEVLKASGL